MTPKKSRSANAAKLQVKESLQLGTLPDDELMKLIAQANTAAQSPRPSGIAAPGITPDDIVSCVEIATAGALLALAEKAAGHSHSDLGRALGVSRQRVKEIMESGNLEIETMARVAAACGYELSISLRPANPDRPVLGAVISAARA